MTPDVIAVNEKRSDVEKMKEKLAKKEKTCRTINKVGTVLTTIGSPSLVASLISPFDFEGPVVEIISGIVLVAGTLMKKFSGDELEEIEAIKYYMESKFENINQLLISDSRTDIAFLSDEQNEGIEFSYAKDNVIKYLEVIKNIYRAIMKSYLSKGKKDKWSFARRTNTTEIEKFKNEPYIDSFLFVSLDKSGVSEENGMINNSVMAYICGESNIPFMKLEDALNANNKYIISNLTVIFNPFLIFF